MIRRPRSESCSESAGDAKSGAKRDESEFIQGSLLVSLF